MYLVRITSRIGSRAFCLFALAILSCASPAAAARIHRDRHVLVAFQHSHPCPSIAKKGDGTRGACPGWQKDHLMALECGGADAVWNLHWLTIADHAAKTKHDNKGCRMIKDAVLAHH